MPNILAMSQQHCGLKEKLMRLHDIALQDNELNPQGGIMKLDCLV